MESRATVTEEGPHRRSGGLSHVRLPLALRGRWV